MTVDVRYWFRGSTNRKGYLNFNQYQYSTTEVQKILTGLKLRRYILVTIFQSFIEVSIWKSSTFPFDGWAWRGVSCSTFTDEKQPRFRRLLEAFSNPRTKMHLLFYQACCLFHLQPPSAEREVCHLPSTWCMIYDICFCQQCAVFVHFFKHDFLGQMSFWKTFMTVTLQRSRESHESSTRTHQANCQVIVQVYISRSTCTIHSLTVCEKAACSDKLWVWWCHHWWEIQVSCCGCWWLIMNSVKKPVKENCYCKRTCSYLFLRLN